MLNIDRFVVKSRKGMIVAYAVFVLAVSIVIYYCAVIKSFEDIELQRYGILLFCTFEIYFVYCLLKSIFNRIIVDKDSICIKKILRNQVTVDYREIEYVKYSKQKYKHSECDKLIFSVRGKRYSLIYDETDGYYDLVNYFRLKKVPEQ